MKIKNLKLNNFAKFTDFECEFNGNVTHLVGINGAGKTTIGLTAIWAGLKGIAENNKNGQLIGERFRFIGPAKATSDIEITLVDEKKNVEVKVKNRISKTTNQISFEGPEGYPISNEWLNNLLSVAFLSAKNFTQLSGRDQALLLGINTDEYDQKIKDLKADYTIINREYRNLGEMEKVEETKPVDLSKLYEKRDEIRDFNTLQAKRQDDIEDADDLMTQLEEERKCLEEKLIKIKERIAKGKEYRKTLPEPKEEQSEEEITEKIKNADETNKKADNYQRYIEHLEAKDKKKKELNQNKESQVKQEKAKIEYIKSFDFGFTGLEVDDDGSLLLNGKPIREPYFSKGELEVIVAKLYASQKPELKVRFIDDFELLDEDNQKKIITDLLNEGFQVITAEVGKQAEKENTVLLRECKKVDNYKDQKTLL